MLEDAGGIRRVILACGFVDLRKGIDGLAQVIGSQYNLNPFEKGTLFLFCGRRSDRMKGLTVLAVPNQICPLLNTNLLCNGTCLRTHTSKPP